MQSLLNKNINMIIKVVILYLIGKLENQILVWSSKLKFVCFFANPLKSLPHCLRWTITLSFYNDTKLSLQFLANVNSCSCSLYVVVRPSVCRLSVTFVHPTQPIAIFGNISAPRNTLMTWRHPGKILRRSSQGNPSVGGLNQRVLKKMKRLWTFARLYLRNGAR